MINLPKTRNSIRNVNVDDDTINLLTEWKSEQTTQLKVLGHKPKADQLVFSNIDNEFLQLGQPRKWLVRLQKKYQLEPLSVHGFRHTHCSLLFEAGASIKEVQDRLGHSDVKTTMDIYNHLTEEAKGKTVELFENHLKSVTTPLTTPEMNLGEIT
jgi:integrase